MKQDATSGVVLTTSRPLVHERMPGGGIRVTIQGPASRFSWSIVDGVFLAVLTALLYGAATTQLSIDGIQTALAAVHWTGVVGTLAILLYASTRPARIVSESVTVTPALGIQLVTTTVPASLLLSTFAAPNRRTVFIPRDKVLDLYIGEGFNRFSILDYLAISVAVDDEKGAAGGAKIQRVFPNLQPRLPLLIEAYNILHHHLFPTTPQTAA